MPRRGFFSPRPPPPVASLPSSCRPRRLRCRSARGRIRSRAGPVPGTRRSAARPRARGPFRRRAGKRPGKRPGGSSGAFAHPSPASPAPPRDRPISPPLPLLRSSPVPPGILRLPATDRNGRFHSGAARLRPSPPARPPSDGSWPDGDAIAPGKIPRLAPGPCRTPYCAARRRSASGPPVPRPQFARPDVRDQSPITGKPIRRNSVRPVRRPGPSFPAAGGPPAERDRPHRPVAARTRPTGVRAPPALHAPPPAQLTADQPVPAWNRAADGGP